MIKEFEIKNAAVAQNMGEEIYEKSLNTRDFMALYHMGVGEKENVDLTCGNFVVERKR